MSIDTKIEWCDSSLNLQAGCDGCELWPGDDAPKEKKRCYAGNLIEFHGGPGKKGWPATFGEPRLFTERLTSALRWRDLTGKDRPEKPWLSGYPRLIFLNDLGDTFTESLPIDWLQPYVPAMAASPHIYIVLTKRPARMLQFWQHWNDTQLALRDEGKPYLHGSIPPNFWLLTSVTGPENVGRIRELLKLRALGAKVLGVSYEPAWGAVDFRPWLGWAWNAAGERIFHPDYERGPHIDWMIAGGESGSRAKPSHPDWFRSARDACQAAGAALFHKQNGEYLHDSQVHGYTGSLVGPAHQWPDGSMSYRVGKKAAGAILDGREWRQMPADYRAWAGALPCTNSGAARC